MVGAYDWDGGVLKEGVNGRIVPPREAFESEFPLELKNHAAYLGINVIPSQMTPFDVSFFFVFKSRTGVSENKCNITKRQT